MNAKVFAIPCALILSLMLTGCNQYKVQKRVNSLEASITSYDVALRWAQYQDAYAYHVSPNGTQPPADLERLNEISVTGVKPVQKIINEDHTEATVRYVITYYIKDQGTLKEIKAEHNWWVNQETNQWFIDSEFPKFFN